MKYKFLIFFLVIINSYSVFCQDKTSSVYKSYLDKYGKKTDSSYAKSYILYRQSSDSLWSMKVFGMNDTIKYAGTYNDRALSVPNGKFIYYYKLPATLKKGRSDTLNYVKTVGYYANGFKVGRWTYYFYNGNKESVETYLNDDLNGPFLTYNYETNTIFINGNYVNDKKEGEWNQLSVNGNKIKTEIYKNDELIKTLTVSSPYVPAVMSGKFSSYLLKNITGIIHAKTGGIIIIRSPVTSEGKLINPQIFKGSINPEIDEKILALISNSPNWKPPFNKETKKNIQDFVEIRITIQYYFKVNIESIENDMIDYYQLMH